jgi:hypothetical protein
MITARGRQSRGCTEYTVSRRFTVADPYKMRPGVRRLSNSELPNVHAGRTQKQMDFVRSAINRKFRKLETCRGLTTLHFALSQPTLCKGYTLDLPPEERGYFAL